MRGIILAITLVFFGAFPTYAQSSPEKIVLREKKVAYVYRLLNTPEHFQHDHCDKYIFRDTAFSLLENSLYHSESGQEFLAEDNCFFPSTGTATLKDGRKVYFFIQDDFNTNGNAMYFCEETKCTRAADENYELSDGQKFSIKYGTIDNYGFFDNGQIKYEDRN